ncbi:endonuclease/exonuclease/phosphatase family protein [Modestobacter sp. VKM Ac-2986]|uniref:endonuclease/exonuclease/phosphatase family protein n=1 Tax=Modestobacter sp. VKM Ac-2986 TaxID=3004140 RepID=UPI0022AB2ABD|nr:endonuclease/exonuclease/phosphatase family protein [Modestobacter sp. VKM Ac-2986]MCZ2827355.1 endonuclease/exonuclease/phosphatase family protein [Modestobacter sp. VKM Ac-2986]
MSPSPRVPARVALALTAPWAGFAALRALGAERGFPLVPALSFTPQAALTSVLPLTAALLSRSRGVTALAAGSALVLGATVLPRARPSAPVSDAAGPRLRVVSLNTLHGRADAATVVALVREHDADVVALMEVTPEGVTSLVDAGIADLLPHGHVMPAGPDQPPGSGGAVWTRLEVQQRTMVPGRFGQPAVRLTVPGALDVELTAVHTHPPLQGPARVADWEQDLRELPDPEDGVLRVLTGDFNATPDHASFRRLLRHGWVDVARATGAGLRSTWSPVRGGRPRLTLDHVLVDERITPQWLQVVHVPGSDHRALVAEMRLPALA